LQYADTMPVLCFGGDTVPIRTVAWAPFEGLVTLNLLNNSMLHWIWFCYYISLRNTWFHAHYSEILCKYL